MKKMIKIFISFFTAFTIFISFDPLTGNWELIEQNNRSIQENIMNQYITNEEKTFELEQFRYSVFSWKDDVLLEENRQSLIDTIQKYHITDFYQHVGSDADIEVLSEFSAFLSEHGVSLYALMGDPTWGLSEKADRLEKAVERANSIAGVAGIVFDVEPGQIDGFDDNEEKIMQEFSDNMKYAYALAKEKNLDVVICVPAWWDDQPVLNDLIENACDSVCVMNYFVDREFNKIETEAQISKQFGKNIISASELQPAGMYGLTENNTYNGQGIDTVQKMWLQLAKDLYEEYEITDVAFSYHNYVYLQKETTNNE